MLETAISTSFERITDAIWELPITYKPGMRVPARLFASRPLLEEMDRGVMEQITNVACLPGIEGYACCMPDGHWATASLSAAWRRCASRTESFRLAI